METIKITGCFSSGVHSPAIVCSRCLINGDMTLIRGGSVDEDMGKLMSLVSRWRELALEKPLCLQPEARPPSVCREAGQGDFAACLGSSLLLMGPPVPPDAQLPRSTFLSPEQTACGRLPFAPGDGVGLAQSLVDLSYKKRCSLWCFTWRRKFALPRPYRKVLQTR